jgi:cellulose biosynthesis protein BcsQ
MGEYGVHYVPSPPDAVALKARAEDPQTLRRMLERLAWKGVVLVDTKSDLEALTRNALAAADRVLIPIADWASLLEAEKVFDVLEATGGGRERGRAVLTLVDSRTRVEGDGEPIADVLRREIRRRGWPAYRTALSRSPRVEALHSGDGRPRAILHHAQGTRVHREMAELTRELLEDLGLARDLPPGRGFGGARRRPAAPAPSLKRLILRGFGG